MIKCVIIHVSQFNPKGGSAMKISVCRRLACAVCSVIMLSGCADYYSDTQGYTEEVPPASLDLDYRPDDGAFTEYTFEFCNYSDKYLLTVTSPDNKTIELSLEDGRLKTSSLTVYAPDGYVADIPATPKQAKMYFSAVNGMYRTGDIPQILRIDFYNPNSNTEENDVFSRYYAVKDGRLAEIPVHVTDENGGTSIDRYPEMMTKMASPTAMIMLTEKDGEPSIRAYEFDYDNFLINSFVCTEDDCAPLYQGYYKYYRAMKAYELLRFYNFNVSSAAPYNGYKLSRDEKYETFSQLVDAAKSVFADEFIEMSDVFDRFDSSEERLMVRPPEAQREPSDDVLLTVNENGENENELTYWVVAGVSDDDGKVYYSAGIFTIEYKDGIWKTVTFSYPERP